MSINDPYRLVYQLSRATWIVKRGAETFFDESRAMIEHETMEEAFQWCVDEFGVEPDLPDGDFQLALLAAGPNRRNSNDTGNEDKGKRS